MKTRLFILAILCAAFQLPAQTNQPIRLAIIAETDTASTVADLLTAQLSGHEKLQLLERDEIQRIYREQALSGTGRDGVKLGRILGADGLLLLSAVNEPVPHIGMVPAQPVIDLTARLIAVKPGVVLASETFPLPPSELADWPSSFASHLEGFLPKLAVLEKDAIPVSIVNLRSAIQSVEETTAEQQVKALAIQRLSQEPRLFVLERQRMELLGEEKNLKSDETPFWNGSYLLEGVLDQNGYSKETITLNARLAPPKGAPPLAFEVSGTRTNLAELVNQLAEKVNEALKIQSSIKSWNAVDEARQFLEEARWALRWEVYPEAQMAAESAWALGKRDLECALVRTKSYVLSIPDVVAPGVIHYQYSKKANEVSLSDRPDPKYCEVALYALQCYDQFAQTSPDGEPKILWRGKGWPDWHDSDWYKLGIESLTAASHVLMHFNRFPDAQTPVIDQLAELRALTRSVAARISESPSIHDSYFVGDRIVTHDELSHTMDESPNIFRCKVEWGCYWEETPEDTLALYRQLMSSPVFSYLHQDLWLRPAERPRLVAWKEEDRRSIPAAWDKFVRELQDSPDINLQLEADAFAIIDARNEQKMAVAFTNFFNNLLTNRETLVTNHVEVVYLDWRAGALVPGSGVFTPLKESLQHLYYSEYRPQLEEMDQDYWRKTIPAIQNSPQNSDNLAQFEKQKRFLKENTPFTPDIFVRLFVWGFNQYSKAQALELQPLFAAYKTNLAGQVKENKPWARIGVMRVNHAEANLLKILSGAENSPPAPAPKLASVAQVRRQSPAVQPAQTPAHPAPLAEEIITNVLTVDKFLPIPLDDLQTNRITEVTITAHHWIENKLLLDFSYAAVVYKFDTNGNWLETRLAQYPAWAILDPKTRHWDIVTDAEDNFVTQNHFYHRSTLWHGELFTCDNTHIKKYNFKTKAWKAVEISDGNRYELFVVNERLYAANENTVFEIMDEGKRTRLLASTRRQPPLLALDTEELGTPILFEGPGHALELATSHNIYAWTGSDWRKVMDSPGALSAPSVFADGVLFVTENDGLASLTRLTTDSSSPELCLRQMAQLNPFNGFQRETGTKQGPHPKWELPRKMSLNRLAAALHHSDLFFLADHSATTNIIDEKAHVILEQKVLTRDGCHAELLCFSDGSSSAQELFLKFNAAEGPPPVSSRPALPGAGLMSSPPFWILFADDYLIFGLENAQNFFSSQSMVVNSNGFKTGIWMMPLSQLEPALAREKQLQFAREKAVADAAESARKNFLPRYDHNHNGIIDPDEKEDALDDPAFISFELDLIDARHTDWLQPDELSYFDANQNKILEPKEEAGIGIALHQLAERLVRKFDANDDGLLDAQEFNRLMLDHYGGKMPLASTGLYQFADLNHDGFMELNELEFFLKAQLITALRTRPIPGINQDNLFRPNYNRLREDQKNFKAAVEFYWQNPPTAPWRREHFSPGSSANGISSSHVQPNTP